LGTEIEVPTIDKKTLRLKIPAGHMNRGGRGDAYVRVTIAIPKRPNKKQKTLAEGLAEAGL
jgi:DnaJ-class molecular chaperone